MGFFRVGWRTEGETAAKACAFMAIGANAHRLMIGWLGYGRITVGHFGLVGHQLADAGTLRAGHVTTTYSIADGPT